MKHKRQQSKSIPEINTSALPDIIFMLLFFFMVVTVVRKNDKEKPIKVPEVNYAELMKADQVLVLSISKCENGYRYYLEGQECSSIDELTDRLYKLTIIDKGQKVKLAAEKDIPMKEINTIKQVLQQAQLYEVDYLVASFK